MSGQIIVTFTGAIRLLLRFINKLLGILLIFDGVWFTLLFYGSYKLAITFNPILRYRWGDDEWLVLLISVIVSLIIFAVNCYLFYKKNLDNVLVRIINYFNGNYGSERDGNHVPSFMLTNIKKGNGFYIGEKTTGLIAPRTRYVIKPSRRPGNISINGTIGSGKSRGIAEHQFVSWDGTILLTDVKGELSTYYGLLKKLGLVSRDYIVFDPTKEDSPGYDPFYFLRLCGEDDLVTNVNELANSMIPLPLNTPEPFWIESARALLAGAILHFFSKGASFSDTMYQIQITPTKTLLDEIAASDNIDARICVKDLAKCEADSKTLNSVAQQLNNKLRMFATDRRIKNVLRDSRIEGANCFSWGDLESKNIFLAIPEDKVNPWGPLITLMLNQLIRTLYLRANNTTKAGRNLVPILLLLDEIARFGKVSALLESVNTLRSRSVTFALFSQSLVQFDLFYGRNERKLLMDSCKYKIVLDCTEPESQEYYSKLAGTFEVEKESRSTNYDTDDGVETGRSTHLSKHREPLIWPHELALLEKDMLVLAPGYCRVDKVFMPTQEDLEKELAGRGEAAFNAGSEAETKECADDQLAAEALPAAPTKAQRPPTVRVSNKAVPTILESADRLEESSIDKRRLGKKLENVIVFFVGVALLLLLMLLGIYAVRKIIVPPAQAAAVAPVSGYTNASDGNGSVDSMVSEAAPTATPTPTTEPKSTPTPPENTPVPTSAPMPTSAPASSSTLAATNTTEKISINGILVDITIDSVQSAVGDTARVWADDTQNQEHVNINPIGSNKVTIYVPDSLRGQVFVDHKAVTGEYTLTSKNFGEFWP